MGVRAPPRPHMWARRALGHGPMVKGDDLPTAGRLMAVDLGDVRIGLATCDPGQVVASPSATVRVADVLGVPLSTDGRGAEAGTSEEALDRLAGAVAEVAEGREIVGFVVGYPRTLSGREGSAAQRARRLATLLRRRTGHPVALWDERLTSVEAERAMVAADAGRRERRDASDRVAASLILQGYLAARRP